MSEELNCKYCGNLVHLEQGLQPESLEDIWHYECHIEYLEAENERLKGEFDKYEEIETDLNNTIGIMQCGLDDYCENLNESSAQVADLQAQLASSHDEVLFIHKLLEKCRVKLAKHEWVSVEDTVANLLCYLVDRYENQPLSEIKLQEIGTQFLKNKHYNKPLSLPQEDKKGVKATPFHDAGAYGRCSYCGRYSNDPNTLSKDGFPCDCGKTRGWCGSFKSPTSESKWSKALPEQEAPNDQKRTNESQPSA